MLKFKERKRKKEKLEKEKKILLERLEYIRLYLNDSFDTRKLFVSRLNLLQYYDGENKEDKNEKILINVCSREYVIGYPSNMLYQGDICKSFFDIINFENRVLYYKDGPEELYKENLYHYACIDEWVKNLYFLIDDDPINIVTIGEEYLKDSLSIRELICIQKKLNGKKVEITKEDEEQIKVQLEKLKLEEKDIIEKINILDREIEDLNGKKRYIKLLTIKKKSSSNVEIKNNSDINDYFLREILRVRDKMSKDMDQTLKEHFIELLCGIGKNPQYNHCRYDYKPIQKVKITELSSKKTHYLFLKF